MSSPSERNTDSERADQEGKLEAQTSLKAQFRTFGAFLVLTRRGYGSAIGQAQLEVPAAFAVDRPHVRQEAPSAETSGSQGQATSSPAPQNLCPGIKTLMVSLHLRRKRKSPTQGHVGLQPQSRTKQFHDAADSLPEIHLHVPRVPFQPQIALVSLFQELKPFRTSAIWMIEQNASSAWSAQIGG